jgi:outer membrane receptor protein involved in Fe transport
MINRDSGPPGPSRRQLPGAPARTDAAMPRLPATVLVVAAHLPLLLRPSLAAAQTAPTPPAEPPTSPADDPAAEAPTGDASLPIAVPRHAHPPHRHPIDVPGEEIIVEPAHPAESASSVHLSEQDLARRPHHTASDLLRQAPGLLVSQHAGGGKADQLFLRGFDADHGTDVALFVDGVPVNLPSHGHGQGYADTHWLIPEIVKSVEVHKGPYAARFGDFYTAGAVAMGTIDEVPGVRVALTSGSELSGPAALSDPSYRLVGLASPRLGRGTSLLAGEIGYTDGPFEHPQRFRRASAFGKWKGDLAGGELGFASTFYAAHWNQSGQIPEREVEAGRLGRFGAIDPSEGGTSSRASASLSWSTADDRGGAFRAQLYAVDYRLRLYSNFTLYARDPENGDQIEQTDDRGVVGLNATYVRPHAAGWLSGILTAGVQVRADDTTADLWHTSERSRLSECFSEGANPCNRVLAGIRNVAVFAEEDLFPATWVHVIAGLRLDSLLWDVEDLDPDTALTAATTGGTAQRAIASPKLSVIFHPHETTALFANGGFGFHSNDARSAVSRSRRALARAIGGELGTRWRPSDDIEASAAAWLLHLSSEQVWSGDAGGTEPSGATRRLGLDVSAAWQMTTWLAADANVALARSTFVENRGNGGALALAPRITAGGGVTAAMNGAAVSLRGRGIGPRPANEDESLTADGFILLDLVASYQAGPWMFGITAINLLDSEWREAQFAEASRLPAEPVAVEDVHFTPGSPLTALGTVQFTY